MHFVDQTFYDVSIHLPSQSDSKTQNRMRCSDSPQPPAPISQQELTELFRTDIELAIETSSRLICSQKYKDFDQFIEENGKPSNRTSCQNYASDKMVFVNCKECGVDQSSCICLHCYLDGNHAGHNITFSVESDANCDCGDPTLWKSSGYCKCHSSPIQDPDLAQLDPETRASLIFVFTGAFKSLPFLIQNEKNKFMEIISYITSMTSLGDGIRRCFIKAISSAEEDFAKLLFLTVHCQKKTNKVLFELLGSLISDFSFSCFISRVWVSSMENLIKLFFSFLIEPKYNISDLLDFSFHGFYNDFLKNTLSDGRSDWIDPIVYFFETMAKVPHLSHGLYETVSLTVIDRIEAIVVMAKKLPAQKQNVYELYKKLINVSKYFDFSTSFDFFRYFNPYFYIYMIKSIKLIHKTFSDGTQFFDNQLFLIFRDTLIMILRRTREKNFTDKKAGVFERSIFDGGRVSISLIMHSIFAQFLYASKNPLDLLKETASAAGLSLCEFCKEVSLLPTRFFACYNLAKSNYPNVKGSPVFSIMHDLSIGDNIISMLMPQFYLIQTCLFASEEKGNFVAMIASAFGAISSNDIVLLGICRLCFFAFTSSLLTDRDCSDKNYKSVSINIISGLLAINGCTIDKMEYSKDDDYLSEDELIQFLNESATKTTTNLGSVYHLKVAHNPFKPWTKSSKLIAQMFAFIQSHPGDLYPFPDLLDGSSSASIILSKPFLAIIMMTLSDAYKFPQLMSAETFHIIANLLIKVSDCSGRHVDLPLIHGQSFSDLQSKICPDLSSVMCQVFSYQSEQEHSLISLFSNYEKAGICALERIGYKIKSDEEKENEQKAKVGAIKRSIQQEFQKMQSSYTCTDDNENSCASCIICGIPGNSDGLFYPAIMAKTIYPIMIESKLGGSEVFQSKEVDFLNVCSHVCHISCLDVPNKEKYICPIDRLNRNCLIPKLSMEKPTSKQIEVMHNLIQEALGNDYYLDSFVGTYVVEDVRLRSNPNCLDSIRTHIMLRQFFLLLWHLCHEIAKSDASSGPFRKMLSAIIRSENPNVDFLNIVKSISQTIQKRETLIFLRRCEIFEKMSLTDENEGLIDWDEVLSPIRLSQRFGVEISEAELPTFSFVTLPRQFIDFARPPYSIEMQDFSKLTYFCIATGKAFSEKESRFHHALAEYDINGSVSPNIVVGVSGNDAGATYLIIHEFKFVIALPSVYLDAYGDFGYGFSSGKMLYLNEEKLSRYTDDLISGEWTNMLSGLEML